MQFESFATFNIAIVVLAIGRWLNRKVGVLQEFNIPEPVTSGLLVCLLLALIHGFTGLEVGFNLQARDFLLLYFFAAIGLSADIKMLLSGGWTLLILVVTTVVFIVLQNLTGGRHGHAARIQSPGGAAWGIGFDAGRPRHGHRLGADLRRCPRNR